MNLDELAEEWADEVTPGPERDPQTDLQRRWTETGVAILPRLVPDDLLTAYEDEWLAANGGAGAVLGDIGTYRSPGGWPHATPYMDHSALRRLVCCAPLAAALQEIIGEPMGVHLNLTGWVSTRRNWHFDQYLNEPYVGGFYAAVWIALEDIEADAGPFEYVPGSHTWWKPISQSKMRLALGRDGTGPDWPTHSERILTPLFEDELQQRNVTPHRFLATRGDVLIWHGRLLHRGSIPANPKLERRALIAHFSGIGHRPDMPRAVQHDEGGWYFPLGGNQPVAMGV